MSLLRTGPQNLDGQIDIAARRPPRVIEARPGWRPIDFRELWEYRDLFWFLVWRDIKVRYAQSVLGIGWAVIQPVFFMIVFTIIFGNLVEVSSEGVPYALFSYAALVPWTYFANAFTDSTGALIANSNMLKKVYFPRVVMPVAAALGKFVDFLIAFVILIGLMIWFGASPGIWVLALPALVAIMIAAAVGFGMILSALAVQYRDVKYGVAFLTQIAMYASPVVYPASLVPEKYQLIYAINPMVGVIEGFRSALLDTNPMPWDLIGVGTLVCAIALTIGLFYFRRMEKNFADVA